MNDNTLEMIDKVAKQLGIAIPDDLMLTGFDCTVFNHPLKIRSLIRLGGISPVDILPDDLHIVVLCVFGALPDLPFNALLALSEHSLICPSMLSSR